MDNFKRAGALILSNDLKNCLMVFQKSSKLWGIPKGQREKKEDSFMCMLREVREEIGLNLNHIKFEILGNIVMYKESCIYIIRLCLDILPILSPPFEEGNENHEISKIEWVKLKDCFKRKNNSITRNALYSFKKYIENNISVKII